MSISHSKNAIKTWHNNQNRSVVMPWCSKCEASAADWWFCVYMNLVMYWICQYLIVKKLWKHGQIMKNRSVVMPWDVLSVGASAADWWCCAYINLVMYWLCQYLIVKKTLKTWKNNEK